MVTLDFLRQRSRRKEFPIEVGGFVLLCLLGAPLVLPLLLTVVLIDALIVAVRGAPRAIGQSLNAPVRLIAQAHSDAGRRAEARRLQRESEATETKEQAERLRREQAAEVGTINARGEVIRFYEVNRRFIEDTLPPALFRTQLWNRFPAGASREQAWQTAQSMISDMLPIVAAGRERRRTEAAEERKADEERLAREKTQRDEENSRHAVGRLTQWYEREKARIVELMPESLERDVILQQLYERFDQLVKESIREMKP